MKTDMKLEILYLFIHAQCMLEFLTRKSNKCLGVILAVVVMKLHW